MDPFLAKLFQYRTMLHTDLGGGMRRTVEWLLVSAIRQHSDPSTFHRELETPALAVLAADLLDNAVEITGADFGNVDLYEPSTDTLVMVAHHNFAPDFVDIFACLAPDGRTACSRALASGQQVIIEDVANDALMAPHVEAVREAGFRSVYATPLLRKSGEVAGVLSVHFAHPGAPSERVLASLQVHVDAASAEMELAGA
jgi:GAF domain-containing protein